ncbi:hypothetical protein [Paraflavitalea speifideaquila]|uniref:hypothetical protein n=1 Tax=Paraflavitalea speifideaquila TaxID=3076558 RepID=UPI0028E71D12|nr:hypothetical protein [Paraflavitalea speifideiaquila]
MKFPSVVLLIFIVCSTLQSCNTWQQKDYASLTGSIAVQYKDKKSSYKWDFIRNVNKKLSATGRTVFEDGRLLSLHINQCTLAGLNYQASRLAFFDTALSRINPLEQKVANYLTTNRNLLFVEFWDDSLFLYDFSNRTIKRYNVTDNSLIYSRQLRDSVGIYRVGRLSDDQYIFAQPRDSLMDVDFILLDAARDSIKATWSLNELLQITNKKPFPSMAYDGQFITHSTSDYLVYYCSFTGRFIYFNKSGKPTAVQGVTIDKTPAPHAFYVSITPKNKSLEIKPDIMFFTSACLYNNELYLLNSINESGDYVVDVYDLERKGNYKESFFVPRNGKAEGPVSIALQDGVLFVLYKNQSIIKYAINHF